jgi:lipoyl-dependent peroxiredoxin
MALASGAYEGPFTFMSRFEEGKGTNPEELIAAAHAGCFSMAFSNILATAGHTPNSVKTSATVHLDRVEGGFGITKIELSVTGKVPGLDADGFAAAAQGAKEGCPLSKALASVPEITLETKFEG